MQHSLRAIRLAFSRELVSHLAARLGERETAVAKAVQSMVPLVLWQLVSRVGEGAEQGLFAQIDELQWPAGREVLSLTQVLALLGGGPVPSAALGAGESLLGSLFGPARAELDRQLSEYAGLRANSALLLLRLVAAVVLARLAQYATRRQLTAGRLGQELGMAKNQVYGWLPADLPHWPGFRRRTALKASHAVWAAKLARPYWVLGLAVASVAVLALLVLGAVAGAV